jgi:hypothetical protein
VSLGLPGEQLVVSGDVGYGRVSAGSGQGSRTLQGPVHGRPAHAEQGSDSPTSPTAAPCHRGAARHRPVDRLNSRRATRAGWQKTLHDSGFTDVVIGEAVDTFGGAKGEDEARAFKVYGYTFMVRRPV